MCCIRPRVGLVNKNTVFFSTVLRFKAWGWRDFFSCFGPFLLHVICPWVLVIKSVLSLYLV